MGNARVVETSEAERERFVPRLTITDDDDACVLLDALTYYEDNENLSDATRVETRDLRRAIADELYLIVKARRENEPDLTAMVRERDPLTVACERRTVTPAGMLWCQRPKGHEGVCEAHY